MYIQITTRCNMSCGHCAYSCTEDGEDMSLETFKAALSWDDEYVSIGGGEPTIHPKFWEFIGLALGHCENVWLAINGSQTDIALALARMAKRGVLACALSQDNYHDMIDDRVVQAFTSEKKVFDYGYGSSRDNRDYREIRNVGSHEINGGRCDFGTDDGCVCPGLVCKPDGEVYACGCEDAPCFGSINDIHIPDGWESTECYEEQQESAII